MRQNCLRSLRAFVNRRQIAFVCALLVAHSVNAGECPLPGGETLEACGRLETIGTFNCPVFRASDGRVFRLPETGGFVTGDRVFVRGTLSSFAGFCFGSPENPRLLSCNTIERCFAECGTLSDDDSPGCLRFIDEHGQAYAIQDAGGFDSGDTVFVTGFVGQTPTMCGADMLPTLVNDSINDCVSTFGRILLSEFGCPIFLAADGQRYDLETFDIFEPGDFVVVEGGAPQGVTGGCGEALLSRNTVIRAFGDTGILTSTDDCGLVFAAENTGQRKSRFVLSDFGGFQPGDRVFVAGSFREIDCPCAETDPLGRDGCIDVQAIGAIFADCGFISFEPGEACPVFTPDGGGGPYVLDHLATQFSHPFTGKTFVVGIQTAGGSSLCSSALAGIRYNHADPCLEGCGVFGQGFECNPLLKSSLDIDIGFAPADTLWVENREGLPVVNPSHPAVAFLKGGLSPDPSAVLCGFPSMRANFISPCPPSPDVTRNGVVDMNDIDAFVDILLAIEFAPTVPDSATRMDFNQDFRLNGEDIQGFLEAFLDM